MCIRERERKREERKEKSTRERRRDVEKVISLFGNIQRETEG